MKNKQPNQSLELGVVTHCPQNPKQIQPMLKQIIALALSLAPLSAVAASPEFSAQVTRFLRAERQAKLNLGLCAFALDQAETKHEGVAKAQKDYDDAFALRLRVAELRKALEAQAKAQ